MQQQSACSNPCAEKPQGHLRGGTDTLSGGRRHVQPDAITRYRTSLSTRSHRQETAGLKYSWPAPLVTGPALALQRNMLRCIPLVAVLCHLSAAVMAGPGGDRHLACQTRRRVGPIVLGLDGQADLELDLGRSLKSYPLRRAELLARREPGESPALWLASIEKVRLDARRIGLASSLSPEEKVSRFVAIVRHRMPSTFHLRARYQRASDSQVRRWGVTRLSEFSRKRVGLCRERSFLLKAMLEEAGINARVRYGVLYDETGHYVDGHAWVEATLDGRRLLIDPSSSCPIQPLRTVPVEEQMPDGHLRRVRAAQTSGFTYVPTRDLVFATP